MTGTSLINRLSNGLVPRRNDLFHPFEQHFNKIYDELFQGDFNNSIKSRVGYPKVDVYTENGKYYIDIAVPGVQAEDVTVEIVPWEETHAVDRKDRKMLKVSGQMSSARQHSQDAQFQVKELRRSSFERCILLPDCVEGDPEATMKDGILKLTWDCPESKEPERKIITVKKLD
jgi:HSP20 family molecular chaperone IbpA